MNICLKKSLSTFAMAALFVIRCAQAETGSLIPRSAVYVGLGGSYNTINFANQSTYGKGTSYQPWSISDPFGGPVTGSAAGSTGVNLPTQSQVTPSVQVGFFTHFADSKWMWGGKLSYSYLSSSSAKKNQLIPQSGGFYQDGIYTPFNGNYVVRSYEQAINHQFTLIPIVGRSFERSQVYFGIGPTYSQTKTSINNITGFADIIGIPTSVTGIGNGSYYSSAQWVFGGAALVGLTYFLDQKWFLDFSYSATMTKNNMTSWGGPWANTRTDGASLTGTNQGTSSGKIMNQALSIMLNKAF
jgi:hypothetical protein